MCVCFFYQDVMNYFQLGRCFIFLWIISLAMENRIYVRLHCCPGPILIRCYSFKHLSVCVCLLFSSKKHPSPTLLAFAPLGFWHSTCSSTRYQHPSTSPTKCLSPPYYSVRCCVYVGRRNGLRRLTWEFIHPFTTD